MANGSVKIGIEYDNKPLQDLIKQFNDMNQPIKTASNAIAGMVEDMKKSGQSMKDADKSLVSLASALGQLDTKAKHPRQALSELKTVLLESTDAYKKLTDQEKNSPFGKALKQSIDQLTSRAKGLKGTLDTVNTSINGTSKESDKSGISLSTLTGIATKVTVAIGALSGVFSVMKDAIMSSESDVDEWGRTMESASALYSTFVSALNSMDISSYLGKIGQIVQSARDAYDAMDELNTVNTIRSPQRAKLEAQQTQLRATIRLNGKDSAAGKAAQQQLKALAPQLKQSYLNEGKDNANAFKAALKEQLLSHGLNLSEKDMNALLPTFSDERLFKQFRANAKGSLSKKVTGSGDHELIQTVDTRNLNKKIMDAVTDEWRGKYSPYLTAAMNAQGQAAGVDLANSRYLKQSTTGTKRTTTKTKKAEEVLPEGSIAAAEKALQDLNKKWQMATTQDAREGLKAQIDDATKALDKMKGKVEEVKQVEMAEGNSGLTANAFNAYTQMLQESMKNADITTPLYENLQQNLADTNALQSILQEAVQNGIDTSEWDTEDMWNKILSGEDIPDETWEKLVNEINQKLSKAGLTLDLDTKTGKTSKKEEKKEKENKATLVDGFAGFVSGIDGIGSNIKNLGVDLGEGFDSVVNAFSSVIGILQTITVIVESIEAISTAGAFLGIFKNGGIVHAANGIVMGKNYIDRVPATLTSGEMVMNEADQSNLWSAIKSGNFGGGGGGTSVVRGEQLVQVINAYGKRTGRGEILK